ncbi:anaphase-promoting complex subunit 5 [Dermacentor andersoni]|uniref:anaphase-promoting complex subunit 5 n=1 Tax=Dermacentor andersoni TaxID=34620 RepID=UPI002155A342|nr:anaphase-promoting complex subunit 5-like [Dermacentor andersoni]
MPAVIMDNGLWMPSALSSPPKDTITAHKLSLLVLVSEYCRVKMRRHVEPHEEPWTHTSQHCRDFAILSLKLLQSPDITLSDLLAALRPVLHPKTLELFTNELAIIRDAGVAGIMDYAPNLDNLLADPVAATPAVLHKSSVLGLFVRRMLLALDKLNFSGLVNLHKSFCSYYDEGLRRPEMAAFEGGDLGARPAATQRQADLFLAQQVMLMQLNEKAALPPPQLQRRINELLAGSKDLFEAHYLSFLNCLAVREYSGADDSLRHYFDRAVPAVPETKGTAEDSGSTRNLRYASFNLATLHSKMGHRGEALIALREAVTLAQDANDSAFLQHALSFLCRLQGSRCDPSQLRCLITRASELGLHSVASFGIQALARVEGEAGIAPSTVFELLGKSDLLNCQHAMSEPAGTALAERAALWAFYGFQSLSQLQSQWLLHASRGDPLRAAGVQPLGEVAALALRNLAIAFTWQGHYQNAKDVLNFAKSLFPQYSDSYKTLKLCHLITSFNVALYQAYWPLVEKLASGIRVLDRYEGNLCRARSLLWQGHFTAALDLINTLFKECCDAGKDFVGCVPHFKGRLYHLKAELFIEASQPMLAIPVLCKGLMHAEKHHLAYVRAMLVVLMAEVQFQIGLPGHASTLLDEVVTIILSHGSLADIGQLCLLRAKCAFSSKGVEAAGEAVKLATMALDTYIKVQLKKGIRDAAYWLALTCNAVGLEEQRNAAAQRFRQVDEEMAEKLLYVV